MRAIDVDGDGGPSEEDYVDTIFLDFNDGVLLPGDDFTTQITYGSKNGYFETELSFRVFCAENYYGPRCTTMCDANIPGNFVCNATGALVCATNYYGPDCTNRCIETVKFVCNKNGSQVCAENYYGSQCDVLCEARNGSMCDENGNRICPPNYYGSNCDAFCEARNDSMGHYSCDGNGNRVCLAGYQNSSTFCTECITAVVCCEWNITSHILIAICGWML